MNRRTFLRASLIAIGAAVVPGAPALARTTGYNRKAAVRYAYTWAQHGGRKRNPQFPDFKGNTCSNPIRKIIHEIRSTECIELGDCTNFASQVIHAGGIRMEGDGLVGTEYTVQEWYCRGRTRWSSSWINAHDFQIYHTSGKSSGSMGGVFSVNLAHRLRERAQPGDILQTVRNLRGIPHTMVITKKARGEIFLTYHSGPDDKDVVDRPLAHLLQQMQDEMRAKGGTTDLILIQFR